MSRQLPVTNGGSVLGMASTDVTLASILKYAASNPGSFGQLEQSHSSSSLREDCCPPPSHEIEQAVAQHGSPCGRGGGRGGVSGGGGRSSAGPGAAASDGGAALEELEDEEEDEEDEEDEERHDPQLRQWAKWQWARLRRLRPNAKKKIDRAAARGPHLGIEPP